MGKVLRSNFVKTEIQIQIKIFDKTKRFHAISYQIPTPSVGNV